MTLGVVAWGDELDDGGDVAGGAEIAGDGDKHVGAVSGGREEWLVDGERARQVAGIEALAGGKKEEPRTGATEVAAAPSSVDAGGDAGVAGEDSALGERKRSKKPMR
jgi:hypothetical protein